MEFLKAILGDDLYAQFEQAVAAYNGKPENAQKQVKLANLSDGGYVSSAKYQAMEAENTTNTNKLTEANNLIAQLQKAQNPEPLIQRIQELQREIKEVQISSEIQAEFIRSGVSDADYLKYKLTESGKPLELDDSGHIKGLKDTIERLRASYPSCFAQGKAEGHFDGVHIPVPECNYGMGKRDLLRLPYAKQVEIFERNPDEYRTIMNTN